MIFQTVNQLLGCQFTDADLVNGREQRKPTHRDRQQHKQIHRKRQTDTEREREREKPGLGVIHKRRPHKEGNEGGQAECEQMQTTGKRGSVKEDVHITYVGI